MNKFWQWIVDNKSWLFSGAGLTLLIWIRLVIVGRRKVGTSQKIRSGKDSTNIQVGHDMDIRSEVTPNDAEEE